MTPLRTIVTNTVLVADGCFDLPVCRDEGRETTISFWKPDADELAQLAAGVPVQLTVMGLFHPPVSLTVGE